jgi:hypothetical protein
VQRVIPFIREHYKAWASATDLQILALLSWHWSRALVSISQDENQIRGLCIIRLLERLEDFLDPLAFSPQGDFIWIELLIVTDPLAQADVHNQLEARWGPRKIVLWDRGQRTQNGAPRIFTWKQFGKLKRRMTYGLI